ncbi:MAG: pyridoxal phosphate-dependent aminotransferase [Bacteroidota bacterium]|nr:pyridoxal phosphate-dependent aminotransferase [Bacteroidota bacterium]
MKNTPIPSEIVDRVIQEMRLASVGKASIREIKRLVDNIEIASGISFIRMEMGVPGLKPAQVGVNAEIEALLKGVAAIYPDIDGIPELKNEIARFCKLFLDIDVLPETCIPTVGSMQGSFAAFMTLSRTNKSKDTTLFIDPGFPVHKMQNKVLGLKTASFDVYNYRGEKLREKLESYFKQGNIHSVLYSNPNNPAWICFTDDELKTIGELANKYGVVVIEDLAYFGMDFRKDYSKPGVPPHQPTVAKYTDNYILMISSSKAFSYAGQRIGMMIISEHLFESRFEDLLEYYNSDVFGRAMVFGTVYCLSSGTAHSAQYALAAILHSCNEGQFNFVHDIREYGEKAHIMKESFLANGFKIVYDKDIDQPIADGFYFTISYPGMTGEELLEELIYYGISAISLSITGSEHTEGLRACVSLVPRSQFPDLDLRLQRFYADHPLA